MFGNIYKNNEGDLRQGSNDRGHTRPQQVPHQIGNPCHFLAANIRRHCATSNHTVRKRDGMPRSLCMQRHARTHACIYLKVCVKALTGVCMFTTPAWTDCAHVFVQACSIQCMRLRLFAIPSVCCPASSLLQTLG